MATNSRVFFAPGYEKRGQCSPAIINPITTTAAWFKTPLPPDAEDHTSVLPELRMKPELLNSPVFDPEHVSPFDQPKTT